MKELNKCGWLFICLIGIRKNKEGYEVVSNVVFLDIKKKSTARKCRFFCRYTSPMQFWYTSKTLADKKKHVLLDNRVLKTISNNYINKKHYSLLSIIC